MQRSQSDSNSERRSEQNLELITSQPEPKQLEELGEGRRENEHRDESDSQGNQSSSNRSQEEEVVRPDLELNYQGNSLVIDMSRIEWIALAIIVLSVASTIYLLR
jgi:hypothetical protein